MDIATPAEIVARDWPLDIYRTLKHATSRRCATCPTPVTRA
jgi:hypothetical protein